MRRGIIFVVVFLALIIATIGLLQFPTGSDSTSFEKLSREFLSLLPDQLTDAQRDEVSGILERFAIMVSEGKVEKTDQELIRGDLIAYIRGGEISKRELEYFMAKVSYITYRADPEANLPGGEIDHPLLNPES
ncbi:MAG: hypothetical protein GTO51_10830 [Candidatus Latescibacteria bacterium]|nr:hypothetical protein [Candidatus Latescibacterota bacterium]NIM66460.1 hypothetical protein [Candidatus Latescibacterota bacterium]NIO02940.1 hypothetical protein [Candidatus Latescibacterota bacterium]NIO30075.1 hypothetical protein [Candidatus Latescibacterota bacterium]NIO57690.1 hypothetical protein [Candidatus Latescibacterota bacterium]